MFRDSNQRGRVCFVIAGRIRPGLWALSPRGDLRPTDEALALDDDGGGTLSSSEKVLFDLAWSIWNSHNDGPSMGSILRRLDSVNTRFVGELLVALSGGLDAIDQWIVDSSKKGAAA